MANETDDARMLAAAVAAPIVDSPQAAQKVRDPNRRPLLVDKAMFARMQRTQRIAHGLPNFPNIDLAQFGTAALKIVFALPEADKLIIRQALSDLEKSAEDLIGTARPS
jgi:hypothetical protein